MTRMHIIIACRALETNVPVCMTHECLVKLFCVHTIGAVVTDTTTKELTTNNGVELHCTHAIVRHLTDHVGGQSHYEPTLYLYK